MYCLFGVILCFVCLYMCTVLLPPGGYPIAVKYISYHITSYIIYHIISYHIMSYHIIPYHIPYNISYHTVPYHISYCIISYHVISYHIIYHITYHTIPYHIIYHIISYRISYYIIPYIVSDLKSLVILNGHAVYKNSIWSIANFRLKKVECQKFFEPWWNKSKKKIYMLNT